MKKLTSTGAFVTYEDQYLMLLRDNLPHIKNPNTWSILGETTEDSETEEATLDVLDFKRNFFDLDVNSLLHSFNILASSGVNLYLIPNLYKHWDFNY